MQADSTEERDKAKTAADAGGAVVIRRGTAEGVLTPATKEDFDYVNANLRADDKYEQDYFAARCGGKIDSPDMFEKSWTLRLRGEIVGYVAIQLAAGQNIMSPARFVPMLSTTNVLHHPTDFARLSRPILAYVASQAPAWVTEFYSTPLLRYAASVRWHEKTMKWHRLFDFDADGERAAVFKLTRKELEK